jgi:3,4-dihydroxy-2-butanone 4-phosphate synthase
MFFCLLLTYIYIFFALQDAKEGTTTGVSAKDRAKTVMTLASPDSKPEDLNRPGHIFPLKYREGGVLVRLCVCECEWAGTTVG